jgi:hypothetical protein
VYLFNKLYISEQQKAINKEQAGQRIKVEHSIGGMNAIGYYRIA